MHGLSRILLSYMQVRIMHPDSMTTLDQRLHWVLVLADGYPLAVQCWPNVEQAMISI